MLQSIKSLLCTSLFLLTIYQPVVLCQISNSNIGDSISIIDQQIDLAEKSNSNVAVVDLLIKKTNLFLHNSMVDDALITANQALLVSNEVKSENLSERANYLLSVCYLEKNLVYESLDYLYKGYELSEALRDTAKISWYLSQISRSEEYLDRLANSMNINLKCIEFFRNTKDLKNLAKVYRSQGVVHTELGNYKTAENYLNDAIELFRQSNDSLQLGIAFLNLSELSLLRDDTEGATDQLKQAQVFIGEHSELYQLRSASLEGAILLEKRKMLQASLLLTRTVQRQATIDDVKGMASTLLILGNAYKKNAEYDKAIAVYNQCITCALKGNLTNHVRKSYQGLANIYGKSQQFRLAYQNLNSYVSVTDSLFNIQTISEANRLENQSAIRLKERQILSQNEQLLLSQEKLKREKQKRIFLYILFGLACVVIAFALNEFKRKKKANKILTETNAGIEIQKKLLEQRNRDIKDSLNYARRIQKAVMHSTQQPNDFFTDSFLIFQPKELVSGDFYWVKKVDNQLLFAVADCTGHGAPGAFMSIIGTFGLNQIVNEFGETRPSEILNYLNDLFHKSFEQREGAEIFDGMDIGLCNFDTQSNELKFAGANIGLNILRKSSEPAASSVVLHQNEEYTLYQTKYSKQSIGYVVNRTSYSTHGLQLLPSDCLYLASDGFTDQFGGPKSKKFGYGGLRSTLCNISKLSMSEQKEILLDSFNTWKGNNIQVDDVTVLGIRIPE